MTHLDEIHPERGDVEGVAGLKPERLYPVFRLHWPDHDCGGRMVMYRDAHTIGEVIAIESRKELRYGITEPKIVKGPHRMRVDLVGSFSWCPAWFGHWTFDTFDSDADVLASFERHVSRVERINRNHPTRHLGDYLPLMGAEERWRWTARPSGTSIVGSSSEEDLVREPPCRCQACRERGIVRIDH